MTDKLERLVKFLDNPDRLKKLKPEQLLEMIPMEGHENILDIGAGTGYLSIPAAKKTKGDVFAYDIQPQMLKIIKDRADLLGVNNIQYIEGRIEEIPSFAKPIHIVLTSLILHEIEELEEALLKIQERLTEGGYLVCVEYEIEEYSSVKPPRISLRKMTDELEKVGFTIEEKHLPAEDLYVVIAKK